MNIRNFFGRRRWSLANAEWLSGRPSEAIGPARECLRAKWRINDVLGVCVTVELLAWISAAVGDGGRAAVLLGASRRTFHYFGLKVFESPRAALLAWIVEHEWRAADFAGQAERQHQHVRLALRMLAKLDAPEVPV